MSIKYLLDIKDINKKCVLSRTIVYELSVFSIYKSLKTKYLEHT